MISNVFRKSLVVGIIILFVGASIIPSMGNPIVVRQDLQDNKTTFRNLNPGYIQDLIDNASDGDTIYIPSGIYYENIIINKSISLVGEDKNTTIIDGSNYPWSYLKVVEIQVDWINISSFTIRYGGNGGIVISSNKNTIFNNIIGSNSGCGIILHNSSNDNIISHNSISENKEGAWGSGGGIGLSDNSNNNTIAGNFISNNGEGVGMVKVMEFSLVIQVITQS